MHKTGPTIAAIMYTDYESALGSYEGVTPYLGLLRERPATVPNGGLGHGRYLRAHGQRIPLPGRRARRVLALRAQLAALQHARRRPLLVVAESRRRKAATRQLGSSPKLLYRW